jgi:type VI secretion system protein ImpL
MQWPAPDGMQRARLQFTPLAGGPSSGFTAEGPWAWFRLLDQATLETAGARDRLRVTFTRKGMEAVFELQADSLTNPFSGELLEGFSCSNGL